MTFESAIAFFLAIFIFGITPGPGVFAIIARSMTDGARATLSLSLGMIISDICYLVMSCFGLATLASTWEEAFLVIRIVGAIYLIYLGWRMWTNRSNTITQLRDNLQETQTKIKWMTMSGFIQGFVISGSNPKVILFYIAFLPTFMDMTSLSVGNIVMVACLAFVALALVVISVAVMASQARRYLRSSNSVNIVNRLSGSIMISAGVYIGVKGV